MASSSTHPRRRPQKATGSPVTPPSESPKMSLRKSSTFSLRTKSVEPVDPFKVAAFLPKRSPTDPKTLELLISAENRLNTHQQDVAKLLKQFDDQFYKAKHAVAEASILNDKDVLAVPTFLVDRIVVPEPMDIDKKPIVDHHHGSDSGIGTSAASSHNEHNAASRPGGRACSDSTIISTHTTVTKSASSLGNTPLTSQFLSPEAVRHIRKHIIQPILREPALKEFHPLIEDIPRRIGAKFIANLRDLEKTLFFLAPDFSKSPQSFLRFCETSIQCLHTTVDLLCEKDQRRPTDRPYTNNYFIDLVEQIRRYAEIMARTRAKEEKGEVLDDMDYSPDEEISIEGGLSSNGKPAELVRKKNGKVIPLSETSNLLGSPKVSTSKRPFADHEMDDEAMRSMARRRKSDRPGDIMHPCRVCDKEFKRPCDLTKHEKTHSRPWKCPDASCRYHELGWPTEKERDRHVNDKHSSSPTMYKCKFPPCTYASKRESNCKQHMEKAHGWEYVRSKSNGHKKNGATTGGSSRTPATPLTPFIATPASDSNHLSTPETPFAPSPSVPIADNFFGDFRFTPAPSHENLFGLGDVRRESVTTSGSGGNYSSDMSPDQPLLNSFDDAVSPNGVSFDQSMLGTSATFAFDFGGNQFQQPTPALSAGNNFTDAMDFGSSHAIAGPSGRGHVPHLSPTGQGDLTLFSPPLETMNFDEGLGDDMNFGQDFTLFDSAQAGPSGLNSSNMMNWGVGGQFDQYSFGEHGFADSGMLFPQ